MQIFVYTGHKKKTTIKDKKYNKSREREAAEFVNVCITRKPLIIDHERAAKRFYYCHGQTL